jgi:hypothetical protein
MYDEQSGLEFELLMNNADSLQPRWWNTAEPFFITAEKQVTVIHVCTKSKPNGMRK